MLFPPSSVFPRFPLPLVFSRNVSGGSRVKSSEETLIGSDSSLSYILSYHLSSLLYPPSRLTFSSRVRRSGLNARENIPAYVPFVEGRISPCSRDFCTFFQDARPSPPTGRPFPFRILMSSERTVFDHEMFLRLVLLPR